jgi:hypothetical protein
LKKGIKLNNVEIDTALPTLCNASVDWILSAWNWLKDHPQIILQSWHQACFKDMNLSYDFLTSAEARSIVYSRFNEDQAFALSIVDNSRQIPCDPDCEEPEGPEYNDDCAIDPSLLCDIHPGAKLPDGVVGDPDSLDHTGDEVLTDSDSEDSNEE